MFTQLRREITDSFRVIPQIASKTWNGRSSVKDNGFRTTPAGPYCPRVEIRSCCQAAFSVGPRGGPNHFAVRLGWSCCQAFLRIEALKYVTAAESSSTRPERI